MKFTTCTLALIALLLPTFTLASPTATATTVTLSYDETYDSKSTSLDTVACSDGSNGLINQGYKTFGSLPKFPYIGGAYTIAGYNSVNCGSCYQLTYTNSKGVKKSINVLAIDHTDSGFNVAKEAMDDLTGGQAAHLGRVNVSSKEVAASVCGL